ncbi:hypothetical protein Ancab_028643 [Ancistrocladus abbreviatus]
MGAEKKSGRCWGWILVIIVAGVIVAAIVIAIRLKNGNSKGGAAPVPGLPGAIDSKYANALKAALQFFDVPKSGKLVDNKIPWRGDYALSDGSEAKLDLSKGMCDVGDHMKFGFPMAYTATVLSWVILEYGDQMDAVKQLELAKDALKWIFDYLINAYPKDNVLYIQVELINKGRNSVRFIQVGYLVSDHTCWDRPETYKGSYSENIPEVATYYNSTGYGDELLWAVGWLYHATGDDTYISYMTSKEGKTFVKWGSPTWFNWDDKLPGTQVLLSRISFFNTKGLSDSENVGLKMYREIAEAIMYGLLPDSLTAMSSRTDSNCSSLAIIDLNNHENYYFSLPICCFCLVIGLIADYVLGNNPMKLSYLVGYRDKYPQFVHHRGASIPANADTSSVFTKPGLELATELNGGMRGFALTESKVKL